MRRGLALAALLLVGGCAHRVEAPRPAPEPTGDAPPPEPDGSGPAPADGCAEQDAITAITQSATFNAWSLAHSLGERGLTRAPLARRTFQLSDLAVRPRAPGDVLDHEGKKYVVLELDWDSATSAEPALPGPGPKQTKVVVASARGGGLVLVEARRIDRCNRTSNVPICRPAQGVQLPGPGARVQATIHAVEVPAAPAERLVLEYAGSEISGIRYVRDLSCPPAP